MKLRKISLIGLLTGLLLLCSLVPVLAVDDGAYTIACTPSYANPLTGKTVDGGTNVALGDSMASSIVEKQLLVEQTKGKLYLTIGLGLASNVKNVRFQIMNPDGSMYSTGATITGSSTANDDTVNHYRIEIKSLSQIISPIIYVPPMGRDVQFFIQLQSASLTRGTGIYNSKMIPSPTPNENQTKESPKREVPSPVKKEDAKEANEKQPKDKKPTSTKPDKQESDKVKVQNEEVTKDSLFKGVKGLSTHKAKVNEVKKQSGNNTLYIATGCIVLVIIGIGGYFYVKKIKK